MSSSLPDSVAISGPSSRDLSPGRRTDSGIDDENDEHDDEAPHSSTSGSDDCDDSSDDDESGRCCWICHGEEALDNLFVDDVCNCKGTVGSVHQNCIDSWVFDQNKLSCPSCKAVYFVESVYDIKSPPLPESYFAQLFFVTQHFVAPILRQALIIVFSSIFRYLVAPLMYGLYFYFPANLPTWEHRLAAGMVHFEDVVELTTGEAEFTTSLESKWFSWVLMWLYGIVVATAFRQVMQAYVNFAGYFGRTFFLTSTAAPPPQKSFSTVERVRGLLTGAMFATGCFMTLGEYMQQGVEEAIVIFAFTFVVRSYAMMCIGVGCVIGVALYIRACVPRKELVDNTKRFATPIEEKPNATMLDIHLWFITYLYDVLLFSIVLPVWGGIGIHYAVSPYCCPSPLLTDLVNISFKALALYWAIGSFTLIIVVRTESLIVVPMFAPGVDLYFIRSVDLDNGEDIDGWDFVHCQVYDMDPLRVMFDFFKVGVCEVFFVSCFARLPIAGTWALREFFFADTSTIAVPLQFLSSNSITIWSFSVSVVLFGTISTCFALFPLQRFALNFLRPIVVTLAELVGLEDFLFDADRMAILEGWLSRGAHDEALPMPLTPIERMFVRRERWLPPERVPYLLRPRLLLFAVLFFIVCSATIWLPFVLSAFVALSYTQCTVGVISIGLLAPFFVTDARLFLTCFLQVCVIIIVFLFSGFPFVVHHAAAIYGAFNVQALARQTYDALYLLRRRVVSKPALSPPPSPTQEAQQ